MRCSFDCMEYLLNYYKFDELTKKQIMLDMESVLSNCGVSIYDFICIANKYHLRCRAIKSVLVPKQIPVVLFFKNRNKVGHYMVLERKERFHYVVYDPVIGNKRIHKLWLYLFWSHICIVCYNC